MSFACVRDRYLDEGATPSLSYAQISASITALFLPHLASGPHDGARALPN